MQAKHGQKPWLEIRRAHAILKHVGLMDTKFLPDFVGYFNESRRVGSRGPYYNVDLALEALDNREASQKLMDAAKARLEEMTVKTLVEEDRMTAEVDSFLGDILND